MAVNPDYPWLVLEDIRKVIEWSGDASHGGASHFTVNRPMADMAQIYAMVCSALAHRPRAARPDLLDAYYARPE